MPSNAVEELHSSQFCWTCLMKKPLRSKHCSICDKCISTFDHHCPWVGNCVARNNHVYFIIFLILMCFMQCWCEWGMYQVILNSPCQCPSSDSISQCFMSILTCHPTLLCMMILMAGSLIWTVTLVSCQLYQVCMKICMIKKFKNNFIDFMFGDDDKWEIQCLEIQTFSCKTRKLLFAIQSWSCEEFHQLFLHHIRTSEEIKLGQKGEIHSMKCNQELWSKIWA